jgi:serine protein kinase
MNEQTEATNILSTLAHFNNPRDYQELHWEGSFEDYLKLVRENPRVSRNAFQRMYDMILSHGTEEYSEHKKKIIRYKFFRDEQHGGRDAVYGIDQSLNHLVDTFKAAARNYGPEKRVILLHGPVGSAKSTIVRLLKKGLEEYSRSADGALYSFGWTNVTREIEKEMYQVTPDELACSMREDHSTAFPSNIAASFLRS